MDATPIVTLSPDLHATNCLRGEIALTTDELAILQHQVAPEFRFVPVSRYQQQPPSKKINISSAPASSHKRTHELNLLKATSGQLDVSSGKEVKRRPKKAYKSEDLISGGPPTVNVEDVKVEVGATLLKGSFMDANSSPKVSLSTDPFQENIRNIASGGTSVDQIAVNDASSSLSAHSKKYKKQPDKFKRNRVGQKTASVEFDATADAWGVMYSAASPATSSLITSPVRSTGILSADSLGCKAEVSLISADDSGLIYTKKQRTMESNLPAWNAICARILQELKNNEGSHWFLVPVDPQMDGVPDYFRYISRPMDLKTIEDNLARGLYKNPFEWQHDVRQIFFNAFKYHIGKNHVWNDAFRLARDFDALCYEVHEDPSERDSILKHNVPIQSLDSGNVRKAFNLPANIEESLNGIVSHTLLPSSSLEAIRPDAISRSSKKFPSQPAVSPSRPVARPTLSVATASKPQREWKKKQTSPPYTISAQIAPSNGLHTLQQHDSRSYIANSPGLVQTVSNSVAPQPGGESTPPGYFEVPTEGHVPSPPAEQKIGINDKSLSNSQRKLLLSNLSKLAPNQRRAALELIQDDLGIFAEAHVNDTSFIFDIELLSIEKQKRIYLYVNQMVRANRERYIMLSAEKQSQQQQQMLASSGEKRKHGELNAAGNSNRFNGTSTKDAAKKQRVDGASSGGSSLSDSDSNSSISTSSSSSSSDDSESDSDSDDSKEVGNRGEAASYISSSSLSVANGRRFPLPDYRPVAENSMNLQIREDVMGRHADFLGKMENSVEHRFQGLPHDAKSTAWPEWKGQVIKQGMVSQREGAPPRSRDELIAEGYDARI
ncbi:bromodomain-containing protein [Cardiosporidium cionae]|uniref:Bromodomain-containing protein n=1 Tax=Cardiosporidium cionae TaxID=476202 RepID=A0ABQ7JF71_9APIC|nr:bromodomain-containing protein [Cardiosporidium cionae]|eukprot:KAF8822611.1 bromodomain-containing protein [Cardiosporidium cionae]